MSEVAANLILTVALALAVLIVMVVAGFMCFLFVAVMVYCGWSLIKDLRTWRGPLVLLLLFVTIHILQHERYGCPQPPSLPTPVRASDGTYYRPDPPAMWFSTGSASFWEWDEVWTDRPEQGGTFVREIGPRRCRS